MSYSTYAARRDGLPLLRLYTPRPKLVIVHPCCHKVDGFPPTVKTPPPSSRPNLYERRLPDRPNIVGQLRQHAPPLREARFSNVAYAAYGPSQFKSGPGLDHVMIRKGFLPCIGSLGNSFRTFLYLLSPWIICPPFRTFLLYLSVFTIELRPSFALAFYALAVEHVTTIQ